MSKSCETCRHYLGNGQCRINLEPECGAGELSAHQGWAEGASAAKQDAPETRGPAKAEGPGREEAWEPDAANAPDLRAPAAPHSLEEDQDGREKV